MTKMYVCCYCNEIFKGEQIIQLLETNSRLFYCRECWDKFLGIEDNKRKEKKK